MASISGGRRLELKLGQMARDATSGKVRVGFFETARYAAKKGQSLPIAQVAFWNNFGTSRAPARPFFSNTIRDKSPEWGSDLAVIFKQVGFNSAEALRLMGNRIKDQLRKAIYDWPADNAPRTVERKGFNKGLIDSQAMADNVGVEVQNGAR